MLTPSCVPLGLLILSTDWTDFCLKTDHLVNQWPKEELMLLCFTSWYPLFGSFIISGHCSSAFGAKNRKEFKVTSFVVSSCCKEHSGGKDVDVNG